MPLSDRDYMRPTPPPRRVSRGPGSFNSFIFHPIALIVAANLVIYLATVFNRNLIVLLGLSPALFTDRPWTLVTNMFVHAEFWHFFWNMLTLFFFGRVVYKAMGGWRFIVVYLVGGLVGNLLYLLLGAENSIAIGASGAVFALAGVLVVLTPNTRVLLYFLIPVPLWIVVLGFMLIGSFIPGVAWQAHLGGLAVGLIAGLIYRRQMRHIIYR